MKPYSCLHDYSQPLLLDVTVLNTKQGTTTKSVFRISQTTPKSVFKFHRKVLTVLNVGCSGLAKSVYLTGL